MEKLNLPEYPFRIIKSDDNKLLIFDRFRKKNIQLTPEEWVRQNMLVFLTSEKGVPQSLISIESGVKVNRLSHRFDAMVSDRRGKPLMLIECKAPSVNINQQTFDQIVAYNSKIDAKYMLVTNGIKHFCCKMDPTHQGYTYMDEIPRYDSM